LLIRCRNGIYVSVGVCNGVKGANGYAHCLVYLRPAEGGVKPLASAGQSTSTVQGSRSRWIYATIAALMDAVLAFLLFQLKNPANAPYLAAAIAALTAGVAIFEAKSSSRSQRTVVTSVFTSKEELCRAEGVEFTAITSAELLLRESRGGVKQVRVSLANGARATIYLTDKELEELRSHIALSPTPTY
jgi:hypothetical protein